MDASDICRVCMEDDGIFTSLFHSEEDCGLSPAHIIANCAGISVEKHDGLPGMICNGCLRAINDANAIISKCRNSDRKLRKILCLSNMTNVIGKQECSIGEDIKDSEVCYSEQDVVESNGPSICETLLNEETSVQKAGNEGTLSEKSGSNAASVSSITNETENRETPECIPSAHVLIKEDNEPNFPVYEEEYLVEELKESLDEHIQDVADKKCNPFQNMDNHCYMEENTNLGIEVDGSEIINDADEKLAIKMEVETLDEEHYENYEAIEEEQHDSKELESEHSIESINCCGCSIEFQTRQELETHSISVHLPLQDKKCTTEDWFSCDICYKKHSSLKALKFHNANRYNKKMRTCACCHLVLHSIRRKRQHEQLHKTLPADHEIKCCGCDQIVPFKQLGMHSDSVHKRVDQIHRTSFVCEVCFLDCKFKQRLESHQAKHDFFHIKTQLTNSKQPEASFNVTSAKIDGKHRFICDICRKDFSTKGNLKSHRLLHDASNKSFKCTICERDFSKKSNFKVHMLRAHSAESSFCCTVCNKSFKCSTNLKTHMRVHTKERPYFCTFCSKTFAHLSDKRRHEIVHSGNYPYKCELCNKPFTRRTLLSKHINSCGKRVLRRHLPSTKNSKQVTGSIGGPGTSPMLPCDLCEEWLASVEDLADHHAEMHTQTLDDTTYEAEVEIE
ncbi:zinc finger protein 271-like [Toxorhynchites rutilus septentrionalis]|uniref:zinc finger protein 271-like n=1 Tax=Toxorhynchites rutilus septentrionalis TaxID=329112 RepID=UPI00247899F2|nr:zinc finger protein 271-like [Toxorhynchites rutilus septentrionalis]